MTFKKLPYCVDVDGTYLTTDLSLETIFIVFKKDFFKIFWLPFFLLRGRARAKSYLADIALPYLDVGKLPRNEDLVKFLERKKSEGHEIYLASASNEKLVKALAVNSKLFSKAFGSTCRLNLKGRDKAEFLEKTFPEGFIYVGNSWVDLEVWKKARQGVVVNADKTIIKQAKKVTEIIKIFQKSDAK
jgi:phosphoserine phosphatase